jgi:hypothetical protein
MKGASLVALLCLAGATLSLPANAEPRSGVAGADAANPPQTEEQKKAQQYFQRAKELYSAGKYSETITELEIARKLDPNAKDLVMNLGIVHEKLGRYDEAIGYLKTYLDMEGVTPAERSKAEGMIKRIEGAKSATSAQPTASSTQTPPVPSPAQEPEEKQAPPPKGRIDGLTIGAAAVAVAGLTIGTGVGIYAVASRPSDGYVTGRDGSYATLQDKTDAAHTAAIVADVSFGIGIVAAVATAWLYFGRPKVVTPSASTARIRFNPTGTGALIGGTF